MSAEGNLPPAAGPPRGGVLIAMLIGAVVVGTVAFAGGYLAGGRRTVRLVESPARDGVAYVFEGRCAAGRCQSLWIGRDVRSARVVETLSGPDEQADEIAWTADGGRVGFLVNGYQLRVFDARAGKNLGAIVLVDPDGFPPSRLARGVTFSSNGAAITFDNCPRDHSGCKPGLLAVRP